MASKKLTPKDVDILHSKKYTLHIDTEAKPTLVAFEKKTPSFQYLIIFHTDKGIITCMKTDLRNGKIGLIKAPQWAIDYFEEWRFL